MEDIIRKPDYMQEAIDLITENTTLAEMATLALEFSNDVPIEESE